jgi:predicted CoA-binding protein
MAILEDEREILRVLEETKRVAVLGIKPESHRSAAAWYVPAYLKRAGLEVVPVPVYFPDATSILDEPVYRTLSAIPGEVDLVVVFRRSRDIDAHVDDIIAKKPKAVWFQLGIRNDAAAERLSAAGIDVVQDRCSMIDHRRIG